MQSSIIIYVEITIKIVTVCINTYMHHRRKRSTGTTNVVPDHERKSGQDFLNNYLSHLTMYNVVSDCVSYV